MATTYRILGPARGPRRRPAASRSGVSKQRAVLAMLLLRAGEVVATDALIEGLWGERPPPTARGTVQVYVSQLRRALVAAGADDGAIETAGAGLRSSASRPGRSTSHRFDECVAAGRAALDERRPGTGVRSPYAEALALWQRPAARRLRLRGVRAARDRAARGAAARLRRGAHRGRPAARAPRRARRRAGARSSRSTPCASGCAASSCSPCTAAAARPTPSSATPPAGGRWSTSCGIEPGRGAARAGGTHPPPGPGPRCRRGRGRRRAAAGEPAAGRARVPRRPLALAVAAAAVVAGVALWIGLRGGAEASPAIPGDSLVGIDARVGPGDSARRARRQPLRGRPRRTARSGSATSPAGRSRGWIPSAERWSRRSRSAAGPTGSPRATAPSGRRTRSPARCCASARRPTRSSRPSACRPGPAAWRSPTAPSGWRAGTPGP